MRLADLIRFTLLALRRQRFRSAMLLVAVGLVEDLREAKVMRLVGQEALEEMDYPKAQDRIILARITKSLKASVARMDAMRICLR